jgi:hypothetical protein
LVLEVSCAKVPITLLHLRSCSPLSSLFVIAVIQSVALDLIWQGPGQRRKEAYRLLEVTRGALRYRLPPVDTRIRWLLWRPLVPRYLYPPPVEPRIPWFEGRDWSQGSSRRILGSMILVPPAAKGMCVWCLVFLSSICCSPRHCFRLLVSGFGVVWSWDRKLEVRGLRRSWPLY